MKRVRRGRATDAIFSLAQEVMHHYRYADPSAPRAPRVRRVSVSEAKKSFDRNKRLTMMQVEPGLFVILIPNQFAYEHYEIVT